MTMVAVFSAISSSDMDERMTRRCTNNTFKHDKTDSAKKASPVLPGSWNLRQQRTIVMTMTDPLRRRERAARIAVKSAPF
jgi:hypothetical protein